MAKAATPGTLAYYAAWVAAERATKATQDLVDILTMAEPIVRAATNRVTHPRRRRKAG